MLRLFSKFCQISQFLHRPHLLLDSLNYLTFLVSLMKWVDEVVDGDRHGDH